MPPSPRPTRAVCLIDVLICEVEPEALLEARSEADREFRACRFRQIRCDGLVGGRRVVGDDAEAGRGLRAHLVLGAQAPGGRVHVVLDQRLLREEA